MSNYINKAFQAKHEFTVICPLYCEDLVVRELESLGLTKTKLHHGAVSFEGMLEPAYRFCFTTRIANNVLLKLTEFKASSKEELYQRLLAFPFDEHFSYQNCFAVEAKTEESFLTNPSYTALVLKDAIADCFRKKYQVRPSVDVHQPDIRFFLYLVKDKVSLYLKLSLQPLSKRGYRKRSVVAPLKENLAAAILYRAGWGKGQSVLVDFMCGSGTILIEAALLALKLWPAALYGLKLCESWKGYDQRLIASILAELERENAQRLAGEKSPFVYGYDLLAESLEVAQTNLKEAGLSDFVVLKQADFRRLKPPLSPRGPGMIVSNPPYGERLKINPDARRIFSELGRALSQNWQGWHASILCGTRELAHHIGLRAFGLHTLYNGPLRCSLAHFFIDEKNRYFPPQSIG